MSARVSSPWLWLLVALQVAIPASYYLVREDPEDERFAWRMFSVVRLQRCEVEAFEGPVDGVGELRPIELKTALHASWQRALERGRQRVVEHFLAQRCAASQIGVAVLERRCVAPSGRLLPAQSYRYGCADAQLEVTR